MYVAHTIHLYKNVGAAYGSNINYVTRPQPFSLQNHTSSGKSQELNLVRYSETPSTKRNMEAEDPSRPPRSSPPLSSSSATCEIVTNFEILPLIFPPHRNRPNRGPRLYTHPICSSIAQLTQPGINSLVVASQLIDVRPVFILQ